MPEPDEAACLVASPDQAVWRSWAQEYAKDKVLCALQLSQASYTMEVLENSRTRDELESYILTDLWPKLYAVCRYVMLGPVLSKNEDLVLGLCETVGTVGGVYCLSKYCPHLSEASLTERQAPCAV